MKIVLLQSKEQRERIFRESHLDELRKFGEVVLNQASGMQREEHIADLIEGADVAITSWGNTSLTARVLDRAPRLKLVLHAAGSVKPVVTPGLWERGIRVSNATEALGRGVAETALGYTIVSLKDMWRLSAGMRSGGWGPVNRVREVYGVTVGVVGAGRAGSHYIKLLRNFDVRIMLYDPFVSEARAKELGASKVSFEQLLAESDVISIHVPSLPETRHMFNAEKLALMKDNCVLINTARGSLIDEDALVAELAKGRLFACLDVTDPEPPAPGHPFRQLPNVVLTPHIAGAVNNGLARIAQSVIRDLDAFVHGSPLSGEVLAEQLNLLA
ncbi:hydroxyacid dehydrogenase [Paenibacillus mesophilus]|uniref:hydroxyacid dehydrogenase n=1 Tax=Paenibacillus mesophilus TaxID=2582849 RepID=UPI00110E2160|nr:hydroxyacid dehydrogenase [Paenibacillus mesophilus]TMV47852.1 hydroxyacid dehydrogenase [Paenibacillus mesophilus]